MPDWHYIRVVVETLARPAKNRPWQGCWCMSTMPMVEKAGGLKAQLATNQSSAIHRNLHVSYWWSWARGLQFDEPLVDVS